MKKKIFTGLLVLTFGFAAFAQKNEWQTQIEKIKPLVTTESEVETILGKPFDRHNPDLRKYQTKEGVFSVKYSLSKCETASVPMWDVEAGVVIEFYFSLTKEFKYDLLDIDMSGFSTMDSEEDPDNTVVYSNIDKGITYTKTRRILNWVQIYPKNDQENLKCQQ